MRVVSFKVEEDLLEQLDGYAIRWGLTRSEAIRRLIEKAVNEEISKEKVPLAKVKKISLR